MSILTVAPAGIYSCSTIFYSCWPLLTGPPRRNEGLIGNLGERVAESIRLNSLGTHVRNKFISAFSAGRSFYIICTVFLWGILSYLTRLPSRFFKHCLWHAALYGCFRWLSDFITSVYPASCRTLRYFIASRVLRANNFRPSYLRQL